MYKKRLVLLILGVISALVTLVFFIVKMFLGSRDLIIPIFFVVAYIAYIFPTMVEEYKICKLDEESGVEEAIMELYDFKITGRNSRYTNLVLPLATFKGKGKENYITLSGDFTNIELIRGKNYKIMFYKNSKMLVQIENA